MEVGPAQIRGARALSAALAKAPVDSSGWRRAVGYHESVAGDLDRMALDALAPQGLVRVQHRSGSMWIVMSKVEATEPTSVRSVVNLVPSRLEGLLIDT